MIGALLTKNTELPSISGILEDGKTLAALTGGWSGSSPISYATVDRNETRLLLIHGTNDAIVDPPTQSETFLNALNSAGIYVRRIVVPGAGHGRRLRSALDRTLDVSDDNATRTDVVTPGHLFTEAERV